MPQASDELRGLMKGYFGSPVDDSGPIQFLKDAGYTLSKDWRWSKSGVTYETLTEKEYHCVLFLVQEWDFGGLVDASG